MIEPGYLRGPLVYKSILAYNIMHLHAPPENFGNFDSLIAFLMHSGSSFWTDLVTIFTPRARMRSKG